jgi:hypothetical protein
MGNWPGAIVDDYFRSGDADDTASFQRAAEAGLGCVAFNARQYTLDNSSGPFELAGNALRGVSRFATKIGLKDPAQHLFTSQRDVSIRDLSVVLAVAKPGPFTSGGYALLVIGAGGEVIGCGVEGLYGGFGTQSFLALHFSDCVVSDIDGAGFMAAGGAQKFCFEYGLDRCRATNCKGTAFACVGSVSTWNVTDSAARNCAVGFSVAAPSAGAPPTELAHLIRCGTDHCPRAVDIAAAKAPQIQMGHYGASAEAIYLGSGVAGAYISDNDLFENAVSLVLDGAKDTLYTQNRFRDPKQIHVLKGATVKAHWDNPGLGDGAG